MSWQKVTIASVCEGIYDGPHATPAPSESGAIFLGIHNFVNGRLDLSNVKYISFDDLPKWTRRVTPQENDIVFSYEATLNLYAIIPPDFLGCLGRRMALIRVNPQKIYYKFLYYYFFSPEWRALIAEKTILGATVDRIPLTTFPQFLISLPPRATQHRIADILSAYDDLIENNQKQIQLLEEAAQRLYKEWFVDLRFPGHESTRIVDGVPEGWERRKIDDICDIVGGATPSTKIKENYEGGNILWATPTDITKNKDIVLLDTEKKITQQGLRSCAAKILPPYTILMTSRASIGFFAVCEKELCTNQGFISCIPHKKHMTFYLLYNLISRKEEIISKSKGSTFLEISKSTFKNFEIIEPDMGTLYKFYSIIFPFIKKIEVTKNSIRHIEKTKNILLPKLISHK